MYVYLLSSALLWNVLEVTVTCNILAGCRILTGSVTVLLCLALTLTRTLTLTLT